MKNKEKRGREWSFFKKNSAVGSSLSSEASRLNQFEVWCFTAYFSSYHVKAVILRQL